MSHDRVRGAVHPGLRVRTEDAARSETACLRASQPAVLLDKDPGNSVSSTKCSPGSSVGWGWAGAGHRGGRAPALTPESRPRALHAGHQDCPRSPQGGSVSPSLSVLRFCLPLNLLLHTPVINTGTEEKVLQTAD